MHQGGINAEIMGYGTIMVHSVVVIPKLRDYPANKPENVKKSTGRKMDEKKDFETILKQALK